jgi:integrase
LKDGSARYRARRWFRGKAITGSLHKDLADAVNDSREIVERHEDMPDTVLTFRMAVDEARAAMVVRGVRFGTLAWFDNHKKTPLEFFGDTPLHRIGHAQLTDYVIHRRKNNPNLTNGGLRHDRTFLMGVFEQARRAERLGRSNRNPIESFLWPRTEKSLPTYLLPDELAALVKKIRTSKEESSDFDAAVIVFLSNTGLRLSEAARLTVEDINLKRCTLRVPMAKRAPREIRIRKELLPALRKILAGRDRFVARARDFLFAPFTNDGIPDNPKKEKPAEQVAHERRTETINRVLWYWSKDLNEKRLHAHALRHSAGVAFAMAGWSPLEIAQQLGHETLGMVMHYTKSAPVLKDKGFENVALPV